MGSNLCEYIQELLDTQMLIRHFLRLANDQTNCADNDCMPGNEDSNSLNQLSNPSNSIATLGTVLLALALLLMIFPNQNQRRPRPTNPQPSQSETVKKFTNEDDHNNNDDNEPGFMT